MLLNTSFQQLPTFPDQQLPYNTVESLLEGVSKQMASSNLARRHSRGHAGQRTNGGNSRITKPSSASNSPRSSTTINRRKTLMGGGPYGSKLLPSEQKWSNAPAVVNSAYNGYQAPQARSGRPVSWHPSSHLAAQPYYTSLGFGGYEMPMTPAVYSGYTSPASSFSPLSLPYTGHEQQYCLDDSVTYFPSLDLDNNVYSPMQPPMMTQHTPEESSGYAQLDWNNFVLNGFNFMTSPPTPDMFPQASFAAEQAIPYQPLEVVEQGEELVALGLYNDPSKEESELYLDNYHSAMQQYHNGSVYRRPTAPSEASGKGLKLEEAYAPPSTDDDDGEDDEEEEEGAEDAVSSPEVPIVDEERSMMMIAHTGFTDSGKLMPSILSQYAASGW